MSQNSDRQLVKKSVIVKPEDRRTSSLLSEYEYTQIICMRAEQILKHNNPFVDTDETDPVKIAKLEIEQKRCPIRILREVGEKDGVIYYESISPNEVPHKKT